LRERKIESKTFKQSERKKKKKKRSGRFVVVDVLLLAGDLSFSSENPRGRTKEDEAGGKETLISLFHLISFERDLLEKRVNI
jgi:hypothetical protein